jgi:type III pantothenate kinase
MFLSIDAGNSNIVFGFYREDKDNWEEVLRITTKKELKAFQLEKKLSLFFLEKEWTVKQVDQIGLSTVVPDLKPVLVQLCHSFFGKAPFVINESSYEVLPITTLSPREIGTDLMANITAAYQRFKTSCIIVDFGTALTFSVVNEEGQVIGVPFHQHRKTTESTIGNA